MTICITQVIKTEFNNLVKALQGVSEVKQQNFAG